MSQPRGGSLLSSHKVCRLAGCSYRQLDYFLRSGIVDLPHLTDLGGGQWRRFTRAEADAVAAVAAEKRELDSRLAAWSSGEFWRHLTQTDARAS